MPPRLLEPDTPENLEDLKDEFRDRYGELPSETRNLFDIVSLKMGLRELKIMKLEQGRDNLVFTFDERKPVHCSGLRIGTPAVTTRGLKTDHMKQIAAWINEVVRSSGDERITARIKGEVHELCEQYPVPH